MMRFTEYQATLRQAGIRVWLLYKHVFNTWRVNYLKGNYLFVGIIVYMVVSMGSVLFAQNSDIAVTINPKVTSRKTGNKQKSENKQINFSRLTNKESNKKQGDQEAHKQVIKNRTNEHTFFKLGVEAISDDIIAQFKGKRIGLITNQTGIDQKGRRTIDILKNKGLLISYIFAPEHGIDGTVGAGKCVRNSIDLKSTVPIVSLYGHGNGKMIPEKIVQSIDVIMFDIQDSGMRHYTYISTLLHAMKVAQRSSKKFVVFDRPNVLGAVMEGPVVEEKQRSFISIAAIPLRHGMTIGELACYFNAHELKQPVDLTIVKMQGYDRSKTSLPTLAAPLSPGLRTMQACYGYSLLGLLGEVVPFGIGLYTEARFQCIVLPKRMGIKQEVWVRLQQELKKHGITTIMHEYKHPKTNTFFSGLRLPIQDINKIHAFEGLCAILHFFKQEGIPLSFSRSFDLAAGTPKMREVIQGKQPRSVLVEQVNSQLVHFLDKAQNYFMYTPFPVPHFIK